MPFNLIKKVFTKLTHSITNLLHYNELYSDCDALRVLSETEMTRYQIKRMKYRMNLHHLTPIVIFSLYFFNLCTILAPYGFNTTTVPKNTLPGQKLLPAELAEQANLFYNTVVLMGGIPAICLLFHRLEPFERRYRMWAILDGGGQLKMVLQNGQILEDVIGKQMLKLHGQVKRLTIGFICAAYIESVPFYYFNEINNWKWNFQDYFMVIWITAALPYLLIYIYTPVFSFILYTRYFRIKQRHQMQLLSSLTNQLVVLGTKNGQKDKQSKMNTLLFRFNQLNRQLKQLYNELHHYNTFWSRYLSSYFVCFTFLGTSLAFFYITAKSDERLVITSFEAFFAGLLFSILLWITSECSFISYNNAKLAKGQRALAFKAQKMICLRMLHPKMLLQFDHIEAEQRKRRKVGFTVFESVQINSKTFELLFAYISVIFMYLVEKKL